MKRLDLTKFLQPQGELFPVRELEAPKGLLVDRLDAARRMREGMARQHHGRRRTRAA